MRLPSRLMNCSTRSRKSNRRKPNSLLLLQAPDPALHFYCQGPVSDGALAFSKVLAVSSESLLVCAAKNLNCHITRYFGWYPSRRPPRHLRPAPSFSPLPPVVH